MSGRPFCRSKNRFCALTGGLRCPGVTQSRGAAGQGLLSGETSQPCPRWRNAPRPHSGATGVAGCKSIGADGCKSGGRRKSNLRQRRDARGSEAESAGGWSSAAAVRRIPLCSWPREVWATRSTYQAFPAGMFSAWDFLLWKNPATGFPAPREMHPAGFYCLGRQQAQEGEGDCRQLLWEQQDGAVSPRQRALLGCSARGALGWGSWGALGGGPHPSPPQQCCDLSTASGTIPAAREAF